MHNFLTKHRSLVAILSASLWISGCGGGGSSTNLPPQLDGVADREISANTTAPAIQLSATDRSAVLNYTAVSSAPDVIADAGLVLSVSGRTASLSITPNEAALGSADVTITVTDPGGLSDQITFAVTVVAQEVSLRQFVRDAFVAAENASPLDLNSREFADDAAAGDFSDLLN